MKDVLEYVIRRATKGVIFDTNVLLVFLVGLWNVKKISRFKRTSAYNEKDFELLLAIAQTVGKLVTTPHILTETCNLCDTYNRQHGNEIYGGIVNLVNNVVERRQEAVRLTSDPLFLTFGLADMSLIDASRHHHLVVTDEASCYAAISNMGGLVVNLNHFRSAIWLAEK